MLLVLLAPYTINLREGYTSNPLTEEIYSWSTSVMRWPPIQIGIYVARSRSCKLEPEIQIARRRASEGLYCNSPNGTQQQTIEAR